mmetsp:Transcript_8628/g.25619  ORF Transcript_8628/g.25619 Transcript_8628/m.25619 type:complete len:247 (-) Transcript_8628:7-747(-)
MERRATSRARSRICWARSLVGTMIRARTSPGPVLPNSSSQSHSFCTSGATRASVLPAPWSSASRTFSPAAIGAKEFDCATEGRSYPSRARLSTRRSDAPSAAHSRIRVLCGWKCSWMWPAAVAVHRARRWRGSGCDSCSPSSHASSADQLSSCSSTVSRGVSELCTEEGGLCENCSSSSLSASSPARSQAGPLEAVAARVRGGGFAVLFVTARRGVVCGLLREWSPPACRQSAPTHRLPKAINSAR